jgi:hypothetical protein
LTTSGDPSFTTTPSSNWSPALGWWRACGGASRANASKTIAFLIERAGRYEFTAQGAFAPLEQLATVRTAIEGAQAGLDERRRYRAALRERFRAS